MAYDLIKIRDCINRIYFKDKPVRNEIFWSLAEMRSTKKRINFGSTKTPSKTEPIFISPILDRVDVPPCVVVDTVYHEMLHHRVRREMCKNGTWRVHSKLFKEMLKKYIFHDKAERWLNVHIKICSDWEDQLKERI